MLDKKQIWAIFLFKFKMGCKAVETTHNINNAFGPGTANTCTVQWWFKKFCKVDGSLGYEEHSGWPSEVNNQLRAIRAHPLTIIWEVANELNINHSMVIWHLKQIGKVKNLNKWVSHKLNKKGKKKKSCFDVSSLFLPDNNEPFIDCAMKSGQLTTGDDLLSGWIEKKHQSTSQGQTCKKKGVLVKFGGLLLALSTISFWIPEKPLHLSSILSKMNAQMHVT